MFSQLFVIVFLLTFSTTYGQFEGEKCTKEGVKGTCLNIAKCQSAQEDIRNRKAPKICSFDGSDPVVCCLSNDPGPPLTPTAASRPTPTAASRPVATPRPTPTQTTTEYIPPVYDYITQDENGCEALPTSYTAPKTGQKAWDKCIEYQEQLIYPCEKSTALSGGMARGKNCFHSADELIVGGTDAATGEFPHMVLLGFGDDSASAQWLCGGTLLSEWFVLTAGHCTSTRDYGAVSYALLGNLKRSDNVDVTKVYKIKRIIKHPEYKPPSKYNDIALLQTDTQMALGPYAVPACLDVGKETKYERAAATGWGTTAYRGGVSDTLQKVTLTKFSEGVCEEKFPATRLMDQGFDNSTQICYGDNTKSKDTCQGDSGGPLQVKNKHVNCMYTIIGVTSFGKGCGSIGEPGIYTRVEFYVPWIESIVWA